MTRRTGLRGWSVGGPAFVPLQGLGGLQGRASAGFASPIDYEPALWLKADAIGAADAAVVSTWVDSSGNGRDATQATEARQPTYRTGVLNTQPVVRFDGGDGLATAAVDLTATSAVTVFAVASVLLNTDRVLLEFGTNYNLVTDAFILYRTAANKILYSHKGDDAGGAISATSTPTFSGTGTFGIICVQGNKLFSMQEVGGSLANNWRYAYTPTGAATPSTHSNTNAFGNRAFNIGARDAAGTITLPTSGDIAEIIVFPRFLTSAEIQNVGNYLGAKYGAALWNPLAATIVFEGDSLTEADKAASAAYPHQLMARLTDTGVWFANPAVSGQTLVEMQADYATEIKPLRNVTLGDKNVCVLWGGTNDMSSPGGNVSAATALASLYTYADLMRADGWYTIGVTMIPRNDAAAPADFETKRATFNDDVVLNWEDHFDALAQPHLRAEFDAEADTTNTTFYNADLVHLTAAGYALIATDVETALGAIGIT